MLFAFYFALDRNALFLFIIIFFFLKLCLGSLISLQNEQLTLPCEHFNTKCKIKNKKQENK